MFVVLSLCAASFAQELPLITVTRDDTVITESCRLAVPKGLFIPDTNSNGVIHVRADGITIECVDDNGAELIRDEVVGDWDRKTGMGYVIDGFKNVTIKRAHSHRYKCNIFARNADGLTLIDCDVGEGFAQRLGSTPEAEDGADWLSPHHNDKNEWLDRYGAAIYVEDSADVTIAGCYARRIQNGIVLDNVRRARVYDCDFSFLSGWGLAMWRVTDSVISRNAFDFCIRGYSHGVYNRGQDSAGILFFEQNSGNVIAENSATHGGDGLFAFAGLEALGERGIENYDAKRKGCNDNLFIANDFSYAAAHGLELTFSFGNRVQDNRFVGNAICGIWGGFSQDTTIVGNTFERNGDMGYGLERGGVNIEHGVRNRILSNMFKENRCAIHLWWDEPGDFVTKPWGKANYSNVVEGNVIGANTFDGDALVLHLRDDSKQEARVVGTRFLGNTVRGAQREFDVKEGVEVVTTGAIPAVTLLESYPVYGETRPVGARAELAGRENIIMTEWFPWDHKSPLVRRVAQRAGTHVYEFHGIERASVKASGSATIDMPAQAGKDAPWRLTVAAPADGAFTYSIDVSQTNYTKSIAGSLLRTTWDTAFFKWAPEQRGEPVPPPDLAQWRRQESNESAVRVKTDKLSFLFGGGGPGGLGLGEAVEKSAFTGDYFGLIARATVPLPAGKWRVTTRSDDGVRVIVDGKTVIENWTHHGPTVDEGVFEVSGVGATSITVEYFEIFGHAVLDLSLEPLR